MLTNVCYGKTDALLYEHVGLYVDSLSVLRTFNFLCKPPLDTIPLVLRTVPCKYQQERQESILLSNHVSLNEFPQQLFMSLIRQDGIWLESTFT